MKCFDLFQLHQKEDERGSMSYIIVKGPTLGKIIINMVWKIVRKRAINKKILLREISNKIGLSYFTIDKQVGKLRNYQYWISIAFLRELLKEYKINFPEENINYIKNSLINSCEKIKIGNGKSLELNAIKELSTELCILAGAHAADGCLHKAKVRSDYVYTILIVDKEHAAVNWYKNCLYNLFGLKARIHKLKGCWMIRISNKIIFRYLTLFFGFPIGKKSSIVKEPEIIKNANFPYRKAFAVGVMTFDGSVTTFGSITLGLKSKFLIDSISDILKKDKIKVKHSCDKERGMFSLKTSTRLGKEQLDKWQNYFIKGTEKYEKIDAQMNGFKIQPKNIDEALRGFNRKFPKENKSKIKIADVLSVMYYNNSLFIWEITNKLIEKRRLNSLSYTPVKMYLHVLEKQANVISQEVKLVKFNRGAAMSKLYSLNPISDWRVP